MAQPPRASRPEEGLRSDELQTALRDAFANKPARLEDALSRLGGLPGTRPNYKLGAAFGVEIAAHSGNALKLLQRLAAEDADAEDARAFLPVAAAYGFAVYVRRGEHTETAWRALADLAADGRLPVRLGLVDALAALCAREGFADQLVAHALDWQAEDDRELGYATSAAVLTLLGDARIAALLREHEPVLRFLTNVVDAIADAPRSAERSDARRRVLSVLPRAIATLVAKGSGGHVGPWLATTCERAEHPALRAALSDALKLLHHAQTGAERALADSLRTVLEGSAAPLRDPTLKRPGTGRGKSSRRVR